MTEYDMVECITDSCNMSFSKLKEILKDIEAWCAAVHRVAESVPGPVHLLSRAQFFATP